MIYFLTLVFVLGFIGLLGYGIFMFLQYRLSETVKENGRLKNDAKDYRRTIANLKHMNLLATDSLNKITADYTHNPALEARVCLDDMRALEIKELVNE